MRRSGECGQCGHFSTPPLGREATDSAQPSFDHDAARTHERCGETTVVTVAESTTGWSTAYRGLTARPHSLDTFQRMASKRDAFDPSAMFLILGSFCFVAAMAPFATRYTVPFNAAAPTAALSILPSVDHSLFTFQPSDGILVAIGSALIVTAGLVKNGPRWLMVVVGGVVALAGTMLARDAITGVPRRAAALLPHTVSTQRYGSVLGLVLCLTSIGVGLAIGCAGLLTNVRGMTHRHP